MATIKCCTRKISCGKSFKEVPTKLPVVDDGAAAETDAIRPAFAAAEGPGICRVAEPPAEADVEELGADEVAGGCMADADADADALRLLLVFMVLKSAYAFLMADRVTNCAQVTVLEAALKYS